MKTLIVEDDAPVRELLEESVRTRGHEVCSCADAEAAWDAYQHGDYPLVLLDLQLPGMDGLQLCRQMRALPEGAHRVILVVTGQDQPETLQAVLAAGADDYLAKPVCLASLAVRLTVAERQVEIRTDRKRVEEERQQATTDLQHTKDMLMRSAKLAAIGQLTAGVAHEILNPINIIAMRLQFLEMEGKTLSDEVQHVLTICREQVGRIVKIAQDLRQFARVQEPQLAMSALNPVVKHALELCAPQLRVEGIEPDVHYGRDLPLLELDTERIHQVILNLIANAIDAMEGQQHKVLRVATSSSSAGDVVRVMIADTGTGIAEQDMPHIFDPFFTTKALKNGMGLGLSICYRIIQDHGGTIWVENNPSGGASFFVELPVEKRS